MSENRESLERTPLYIEQSPIPIRKLEYREVVDDVMLSCVDGVGALTTQRLLQCFGSASAALAASELELREKARVKESVARKIREARGTIDASAIVRFCEENNIQILTLADSRYPERLRELDNPPPLLYVRGTMTEADRFAISIVGTRNVTNYGRAQATRLARDLAEMGFTIVSGLALGVDGVSHRAALDAKGRTIAVLGGGVARIYPREHEDLAARVVQSGALISEYHPLMEPLSGNFPARNRIVSGLSVGVLVIESKLKGGSMITARYAAEQNREVFAVPGAVDVETSRGCHALIREGAALVETAEDIVAALPAYARPEGVHERSVDFDVVAPGTLGITERSLASIRREPRSSGNSRRTKKTDQEAPSLLTLPPEPTRPKERPALPPLNDDERKIVDSLKDAPITIDELIRATGLASSRVISLISALEFKKVLKRCEGASVMLRDDV